MSADAAIIQLGGTYSIQFARSPTLQAVGSLLLDSTNATLNIGGGRTLAVTNGVQLSGGTLFALGGLTAAGISQSGGTLSAAGTVVSSGAVDFDGGAASITSGAFTITAGGIEIGASGSLAVSGGAATIAGGATLSGNANFSGGAFFVTSGGLAGNPGSAILVNGGTVTVTGDTTLISASETVSSGSYYGFTGGLSLNGGATLAVTGGSATFDNTSTLSASSETVSGGTFYVDAGGLSMLSGNVLTVNGGNAVVAQATTLSASSALVSSGTLFVVSGGLTVAAGATLSESGGLTAIRGGVALNSGLASVSGGTFAVQSGGVSLGASGSFVATGGTETIVGGAVLSGGMLSLSGVASLSSDTININSGVFALSGSAAATISGAASFATSETISAGTFSAGTLAVTGAAVALTLNGGTVTTTGASGGVVIGAGAAITLGGAGAALNALTGGIALQGTLSGFGEVIGGISGGGTVLASGGVLDLTSDITSSTAGFSIASTASSMLRLDGSAAATTQIQFNGTSGALELNDVSSGSINFNGTIAGLHVSSTSSPNLATQNYINVQAAVTNVELISDTAIEVYAGATDLGTINLASSAHGYFVNFGSDTSYAGYSIGSGTDIFLSAVCFAAGTRILTPSGDVTVEALAVGDRVITVDGGAHPVRWIGRRRLDLSLHSRPELVAPIIACRDAFGHDQPRRDLALSPDHCVFVEGGLIPIKLLLNGRTIVQDRLARSVIYYHIELDHHAVLLAENLPAESYLDTGNRSFFANGDTATALHPVVQRAGSETDACAPILRSRERLLPLWQRLAERADEMGYRLDPVSTTTEPALHLVDDGRVLLPVMATDTRAVFVVGGGMRAVKLVSRSGIPADDTPCLDELRRLGVAVTHIAITDGTQRIEIPPDHPALRRGWHDLERDGATMWRWTNGAAEIDLPNQDGPVQIEISLRGAMTYPLPPQDTQTAPLTMRQ